MTAASRRDLRNGLLFISPYLIGFTFFIGYPMIMSLYYSLTDFNLMKAPNFIGLTNYLNLILRDELFWTSLENTLYFVAFSVPLCTAFAIFIATLLNTKLPGISIFRTVYYIPSIVPAVASSIIWIMLLNPQFGMVNTIIRWIGLPAPGWLADPAWAKPALVFMSLWGTGSAIVIYLAGLQDVPKHLIEAAILDGANIIQRFFNVTIPMISPVILFNVIMGLIGAFQYFTHAYIMTNGGPNNATLFYALYLYRNAFQYIKMGYASALAWLLLLLTLLLTLIVMRSSARLVYYGGE